MRINQGINRKIKNLYSKELTAKAIADKLSIPMHQVYDSLIKQGVRRRNKSLQNKIRFENAPLSFKFKDKLSDIDKELLASGVMLYNGEGAKTGTTVDFANSSPASLQVFLAFLRKICRVDEKRLRFYLYCFSDQDVHELISFWCNLLSVRREGFTKPYIRDSLNKGKRTMSWGVLHIRYSDKKLLDKILSLTHETTKRLVKYGQLPK